MKTLVKISILTAILAVAIVNSCKKETKEKTLASIEVTTQPTKKTYFTGEQFDPAGLVVTVTFSDGSKETVTAADATKKADGTLAFDYNFAQAGENVSVTVSYTWKDKKQTATITGIVVRVPEVASITVTAQPAKKTYEQGEAFDPAGMKVTATYNNNTTAEVPNTQLEFSYNNFLTVGTANQTVTIKYQGISTTINDITVTEALPAGIAVTTPPSKMTYEVGEAFNPAGLVITATYAAAALQPKTVAAPSSDLTYNVTTFETAGTNITVQVTYKGEKADITGITVAEAIPTGIVVNWTGSKYFGIGEPLNSAEKTWTVTATYAGGRTETIQKDDPKLSWDASFSATPSTSQYSDGDKTVTITYMGRTVNVTGISVRRLNWRYNDVAVNGTATILLYADEVFSSTETQTLSISNKTITLKSGNSNTYKLIEKRAIGNPIDVSTNGKLTLDRGVTLDGSQVASTGSPLVRIHSGGELTMLDGVEIKGSTINNYNGAAVFVSMGKFFMRGGKITGNTTTNNYAGGGGGGGVCVGSGGGSSAVAVFEMSGGEITGNTAVNGKGNDVYVFMYSTIKLSGSAKIGDLMIQGNITSSNNAKLIVDGSFTGSVAKLDLSSNNSGVAATASYWVNKPVVTKGDGLSDAAFRALLAKFPLGQFTNSDCTQRETIATYINLVAFDPCTVGLGATGGSYLYGTKPEDIADNKPEYYGYLVQFYEGGHRSIICAVPGH